MVGHLSVADLQIVYYKQLCGSQMEVWLARYLHDLRNWDEANRYYRNVSWNNTTWALL